MRHTHTHITRFGVLYKFAFQNNDLISSRESTYLELSLKCQFDCVDFTARAATCQAYNKRLANGQFMHDDDKQRCVTQTISRT